MLERFHVPDEIAIRVDHIKLKKIVEKKTISKDPANDQMIVGTFWFNKAKDFFKMCEIEHCPKT